jgi:hypothetical protein
MSLFDHNPPTRRYLGLEHVLAVFSSEQGGLIPWIGIDCGAIRAPAGRFFAAVFILNRQR